MGTFALLLLIACVVLRRPDFALLIYSLHWALCRVLGQPTIFDRLETWLRRVGESFRDGGSRP